MLFGRRVLNIEYKIKRVPSTGRIIMLAYHAETIWLYIVGKPRQLRFIVLITYIYAKPLYYRFIKMTDDAYLTPLCDVTISDMSDLELVR